MSTFYSAGYLRLDISFPFLWEGIHCSTIAIIKYSIILSDYIFNSFLVYFLPFNPAGRLRGLLGETESLTF
jgi:hypothetical protein